MSRQAVLPAVPARPASSRARRIGALLAGTALLGVAALFGPSLLGKGAGLLGFKRDGAAETRVAAAPIPAGMLDPRPALAPGALRLAATAPLPPAFRPVAPSAPLRAPAPKPARVDGLAATSEGAKPAGPIASAPAVSPPLPTPRPAEFRSLASATPTPARPAGRSATRRSRVAALAAPPADTRSFWDKLFGIEPAGAPALSYASLDTRPLPMPERRATPVPNPGAGDGVAFYDIGARVLTLPGGERLEAHSGLGPHLDDPRFVHLRMRGATPPGTYDLTEREALFHGVRAIRLNPVGGSAAVHGRAGLLAHTYMLGPNGDSNGCVSVRDYDRFLQAFLRGEIRRLVVVAGRGWDAAPSGAATRTGRLERPDTAARDG